MSKYVCSDFHGFKSLYEQINAFLKPEDTVIFLGDAADRGPFGWELIKLIIDNPQWIYMMGNHDQFLVQSQIGPDKMDNHRCHLSNGGQVTMNAFYEDTKENQKHYISELSKAPYEIEYVNKDGKRIICTHSGLTSEETDDGDDLVWDRGHFHDDPPKGVDVVFHGHTTIPHLITKHDCVDQFKDATWEPGTAFWYRNGRKCDIDNCTIVSGYCVLVDLDTFEEYSFKVSEDEEGYTW